LGSHFRVEQLTEHEFLNDTFVDQYIGRVTVAFPSPISLAAHSTDLTTSDNNLWGIIDDKVTVRRSNTNAKLRAAIADAFTSLTP
jgi:hypothetical protein